MVASDTFGLIDTLGRDCAGALVIQPADQPPPLAPTTLTAEPLTDAELGDLVANLRRAPLGVGKRVRLSLAGVGEKLLLTSMVDGGWGRPVDGTPSTHLLKPESARCAHTVENEAFCMRVAKHLGLAVANVETTQVGGHTVIVVERYDRTVRADGSVDRIHQEDFCQATRGLPLSKYEQDGGPSLKRIADILQAASDPGSIETLLRAVTLNVLIGNGGAHAKKFSLLHDSSGALHLAPLYDLMCTHFYGDANVAMHVDNVRRTDRVTTDRIVAEATRWGLSQRRAIAALTDLLERAPDAVVAARHETKGLPPGIGAWVDRQLRNLRGE